MAEKSIFWTTGAGGDGAAAYTQDELVGFLRRVFIAAPTTQCVVAGLSVTAGSSQVTVAAGNGLVYGYPYETTASVVLAITTPVVGTTGGIVALKADWSAKTVRAIVKRNTDGVAAIPAATQTAGTTWEVILYTFTITIGGVVTLTDTRGYVHTNLRIAQGVMDLLSIGTPQLIDAAVTLAKMAANSVGTTNIVDAAVTLAKLAVNSVGTTNIVDAAVTLAKLATNSVSTIKIVDAAVTLAKLAANSVDNTKIVNGEVTVGKLGPGAVQTANIEALAVTLNEAGASLLTNTYRIGGNVSDWSVAGVSQISTDYPLAGQLGMSTITLGVGVASNTLVINFPIGFTQPPMVMPHIYSSTHVNRQEGVFISAVSTTQVTLQVKRDTTVASATYVIAWMAIGLRP